jgi:hypothetical protein
MKLELNTNILAKILKGFFKLSLLLILFVFSLFFILAGIVQVPSVQHYLLEKSMVYASDLVDHKVTIQHLELGWFDEIVLHKATLYDKDQGKMIYLET